MDTKKVTSQTTDHILILDGDSVVGKGNLESCLPANIVSIFQKTPMTWNSFSDNVQNTL